ncbi:hypothetical protein RJ47_00645 [Vibrio sinaloensis]|nr:hypothetical protein RJ47_00645 [Vibrio sinaloensis]
MNIGQSINKKLTLQIIMFSTLVTLFVTAFQLYSDFLVARESIEVSQKYIFTSYKDAMEESIWVLNSELIESQINGIISIPDISYVRIEIEGGKHWERGEPKDEHILEQTLNLEYSYINQKAIYLGRLIVQSDLWVIYNSLIDKALIILLSNGFKTFIVAAFIIYLVNTLVTKPLNQMSAYFKQYRFKHDNPPMVIDRKAANDDEIDFMINIVNRMCSELSQSYGTVIESQRQLAQALTDKQLLLEQEIKFKEDLELMVQERTKELEATLLELQDTQATMIESEKMASLGNLVAGIAHEINTPLGISITSSSFASTEINQIMKDFEEGKLESSTFSESMKSISQSFDILNTNLQRAAILVSSFKQIAVDQTDESSCQFFIKEHVDKLVVSLSHELRKYGVSVKVNCCEGLQIESYSGAYIQVFTNLITNSLKHGFEDWQHEKTITISIVQQQNDLVIDYQDTGRGVPESVRGKVFEPFVTTKRGTGGTGLGANIIYNIVSQKLQGKIECLYDLEQGAHFLLTIPLNPLSVSHTPHEIHG